MLCDTVAQDEVEVLGRRESPMRQGKDLARDNYPAPAIQRVTDAVDAGNISEILREAGYDRTTYYRNKPIESMRVPIYLALCKVLDLNPQTGLPSGGIRRRLHRKPSIGGKNQAMFSEDVLQLPTDVDVSDEEMRLVLDRRKTRNPFVVFDLINDEIDMYGPLLPEMEMQLRANLAAIRGIIADSKMQIARRLPPSFGLTEKGVVG